MWQWLPCERTTLAGLAGYLLRFRRHFLSLRRPARRYLSVLGFVREVLCCGRIF